MIPISLFQQPLGPALILFLGGVLLASARRLGRRSIVWSGASGGSPGGAGLRLLRLRRPIALTTLLIAAIALFAMRKPETPAVLQWSWQPLTVAGGALEWRLDAWNWLTSALLLLLVAVAVLLEEWEPSTVFQATGPVPQRATRLNLIGAETERTLWLGAAVLVFVCSGNVLTLASSWVLLDAALAARLRPGGAREPAGRAWSLLTLTAMLLLLLLNTLGEGGIRTPLSGSTFAGPELALLWALALVRAGVYPLQLWLTGPGVLNRSSRITLSLIAPAAGLWLLARVHDVAGPDWLRRPEWAALGAFALLGSAMVSWSVEDETWRWRWIAINRASLVVLAAYVSGASGPEALAWPLIAFLLGCALLLTGQAIRQQSGWAAPVWLAALVVWGLPGTSGFLARTALVFPTDLPVAIPVFGIVLLAEILIVAALWQATRPQPKETPARGLAGGSGFRLAAALLLTAIPALVWGIAPDSLATLVSWPENEAFPSLGALMLGARRSVWVGLVVSAALGVALGRARHRIFGQLRGWQSGVSAIASLEWLYGALASAFGLAASGLRYFATLGEGEGYLGWLALGGLILWVLLRG